MTKTWCVGGRHYGNTVNENKSAKVNPKTKRLKKLKKENAKFAVVVKVKF